MTKSFGQRIPRGMRFWDFKVAMEVEFGLVWFELLLKLTYDVVVGVSNGA